MERNIMTNQNDLICTISGQNYRAAYACKAVADNRPTLNNLFISEDNELVSTDGHMLYIAKLDNIGPAIEPVVFDAPKIKVCVHLVDVYLYDENSVLLVVTGKTGTTHHICKRHCANYPDYRSIVHTFDTLAREPSAYTAFAFQADLLVRLRTVFGKGAYLRFNMPENNSAALITARDTKNTTDIADLGRVYLMPVRTEKIQNAN